MDSLQWATGLKGLNIDIEIEDYPVPGMFVKRLQFSYITASYALVNDNAFRCCCLIMVSLYHFSKLLMDDRWV